MKKHFVVFPSATTERANAAIEAWANRGYLSLVFQDIGAKPCNAHVVRCGKFPGYYKIINELVEDAFNEGADLVTCAADDMFPDPYMSAQTHSDMYFDHFKDGEGVMQCTGDRQGIDSSGLPAASRICGSPTFGREWAIRGYMGKGPLWDGYNSFYADEDLLNVAKMHTLLYQERSITIQHKHWSFGYHPQAFYQKRNSDSYWNSDKALFFERKLKGFPDSGLLPL